MNFLLSLLGGLIGLILAVAIIVFIIYKKVKATIGMANISSVMNTLSNVKDFEKEEYSRPKDIKGMTNLLEQEILRDFPDFNTDLLFQICNNNYRKIFNAIEEKDYSKIENDEQFTYLRKSLKEQIIDMTSSGIFEKFDSIDFHRNAICAYSKKNGKATIQVSTTMGYYYSTNKKDKLSFTDIKKQTRYTSEFVYVYDEAKYDNKQVSFSVSCPNCGAPLKGIGNQYCEYCSTYVENINLKVWKMSSFKEDYNK